MVGVISGCFIMVGCGWLDGSAKDGGGKYEG